MTKTTITPFVNSTATEVELSDGDDKKVYWKKEILPSGTRKYKGQTLDFSKINPAVVAAFDEKVLDSVPFVLALTDNAHPEPGQEAETLEGDLDRLEMTDGRLFGYFDFSESPDMVAKIKKSNGKFGVSARIDVGYTREDTGKTYDYVLSHVCGTTRPHIKGMQPWEAVTLSEESKKNMTVDLSTEVIDEETTSGEVVELPEGIAKADFDKVLAFIKDQEDAEKAIEKLTGGDDKDKGAATLSESDRKAIELSESRAATALKLAEEARAEAAQERWNAQKALLIRDGVPPAIVNLAEPVLSSPKKATIKLSDSDEVDASKVISDILDACKGTLKFGEESGSQTHREGGKGDLDKEFAEWAGEWGFDVPSGQ